MPAVKIRIPIDHRIPRTPAITKTLWNAAKMVRDLWLARGPHISGDYVDGLKRQGSIAVTSREIVVTNVSPHASYYEAGTKAFNWGLAMLAKGKGVKRAKDGSRYKIIHVKPQGRAAFRKATVGAAVIASFRATVPKGRGKFSSFSSFKDIGTYKPRAALVKPIKARKPLKGGMEGFFVVSEKAIKADPKKWFHDAVPGKWLARSVEREAQPVVQRAIAQAVAAEAAVKARR